MTITIFYSWQSDSPSKTNRWFIKDALESAVKQLMAEGHVEEAPRVDHDTNDVHGDPDIFSTILQKIDNCDVFIADVTIVATTPDGKNIPNPNVLLELGYAYKVAGSGRIIKIMNESYGDPSKGLPFDLAHKRWPYVYSLPSSAEKMKIEKINKVVSQNLSGFIRMILENEGPKGDVGQIANIHVSFEKKEITSEVHRYSLLFSVEWQGPRDQDFFNITLLWPKEIKIINLVEFERGEDMEIDGIIYEELSLFVDKRLWPKKIIKAIGGKAIAQLEYIFDNETHRKVHSNLRPKPYSLYYKFYTQEWEPIEGQVSFKDLNVY